MMCALTVVLLSFPGTPLAALWRLNPDAYEGFKSIGWRAVVLMTVVGTGCACAAVGLWRGSRWGVLLAVSILAINLGGDLFNALVRHDFRALIGLPIAGAMIIYLMRAKPARPFREDRFD